MVHLLVIKHHVTLRLFVHLHLKFRSLSLIPLIFRIFVSLFQILNPSLLPLTLKSVKLIISNLAIVEAP